MATIKRPGSFWFIAIFLTVSIVLILVGQTLAVFNYELTVSLGLQENPNLVGELGVQINRSFASSDTLIYIPLMVVSVFGLIAKKRWAIQTTAAVAGISIYWSVTAAFLFLFLPGTPNYSYSPAIDIWLYIGAYMFIGAGILISLISRGESLLR